MRNAPTTVTRRILENVRGRVIPSPVGLAMENEVEGIPPTYSAIPIPQSGVAATILVLFGIGALAFPFMGYSQGYPDTEEFAWGFGSGIPMLLAGGWLGYATVRPPAGTLRRVAVSLAILANLGAMLLIGVVIVWMVWLFFIYSG